MAPELPQGCKRSNGSTLALGACPKYSRGRERNQQPLEAPLRELARGAVLEFAPNRYRLVTLNVY